MSALAELRHDLRTMSREQILLRLLIVLAAETYAVVLTSVSAAGLVALVVVMALGMLTALLPQTSLPSFVILYLLASWVVGVESAWTSAALPAALALLVFHAGCTLAASVPPQSPLPTALLTTQARRLSVVAVITVAVWAAAWGAHAVTLPGGIVAPVVGLAVLVAAAAGHYRLVTRRSRALPR